MSDFSSFSDEQRVALASLPYKIGVWISHAEDEKGEDDDRAERRALQRYIAAIAILNKENAFVEDVIAETLRHVDLWRQWEKSSMNVLQQIEDLMPLLVTRLPEQDLKAFRKALVEAAITVAEAHNEFGDLEHEPQESFFARMAATFSGFWENGQSHPMNISAAEDAAIAELSKILAPKDG